MEDCQEGFDLDEEVKTKLFLLMFPKAERSGDP